MTFFSTVLKLKNRIKIYRKHRLQLAFYYPKKVYDPLARKEMSHILRRFNVAFYEAYPEQLNQSALEINEIQPRSHGKEHEIQHVLKLCKAQKVRKKDLIKIEEFLNLQYVIEAQLTGYNQKHQKAIVTKKMISQEEYSSFFPELYEERMKSIEHQESYSLTRIRKLEKEKLMCEKAIRDLIDQQHNFWGDAGKLISGMIVESVRQVADVVGQSFRKK